MVPVGAAHVGATVTDAVGAAGIAGAGLIATVAALEIHPVAVSCTTTV